MNKEQFDKLTKYLHYWNTLQTSGTLLYINPEDAKEMSKIYKEINRHNVNLSCNDCVRDMFNSLFNLYNNVKQVYENNQTTQREIQTPRQRRPRIQQSNRS